MKRTFVITAALLFAATTAFADLHGSWTASVSDTKPGRLHMNITRGNNHQFGNSMNIADFTNLTEGQVNSGVAAPVQFQLARDAGTVSFEGTFKNGDGAGQWTFAPSRSYVASIRALGVDFDDEKTDEDDLLGYALLDVSTSYIKSMMSIGYRESMDKYTSMRIFNVTPEYVAEMRDAGFDHLSADDLVTTRIHKVTPDYIRQMRAAGWKLSLDELVSTRIHKATPEFAEEMRKLGYPDLSYDDLIAFRIHKVTPEFIKDLRELGYDHVSADNLVSMRIFKVTPEYIRDLKAAGYSGIPVEKLIDMKIHRIDITKLK
ncbi:MAG: hypothetical protein DMF56_24205 [Acidobacteria bacterium]|nr:MAG: hypothetical protein DMF56_24205 [Acidobacteriota bacterium]